MISLNQVRTLIEVARSGSVGAAAERLVVSQPAVSSALAGLQKAIGAAVVEREGRGIRLTPSGERLVAYGRRIIALLDEAVVESRAAASPDAGRVKLSAVTTAAEQLLPALLSGFRAIAESIEVELHVANKDRVWDRLDHWEADLVLAGRPPQDGHFRTVAVRSNSVVVVGPPGRDYDLRDLARATWLLREVGSGTRETTRDLFAQLSIAPPAVTIGSNGAIRECVRAGLGISVLSRDAVAREIAEGTLAEIPTPVTPLVRDWHLVAGTEREMPPGAQRFIDFAIATGTFEPAPALRDPGTTQ
ncbi:MAG: LysR family transcriptional regulator [Candidatus Eremiobacteraeota bacterium]|jgi:DNA-binding transcriptional LysR family regulator|nr:LysR family transcriptional regulator [Candidatus Eremiobacteraeota bacterium]